MSTSTRQIPIELRAEVDGPDGILTGYASVYETSYAVGGGLSEVIRRNAFADSIRQINGVVPVFWNHGWAKPANATPIGVARVREDDKGLFVEAELFMDTTEGTSVWRSAKAGALREWSIGFKANEVAKRDAKTEEVITGSLLETSVVVCGANPGTEMLDVRSAEDDADDQSETDPPEGDEVETEDPPAGESEDTEPGDDAELVERAYGLLSHRGGRLALSGLLNQTQE